MTLSLAYLTINDDDMMLDRDRRFLGWLFDVDGGALKLNAYITKEAKSNAVLEK